MNQIELTITHILAQYDATLLLFLSRDKESNLYLCMSVPDGDYYSYICKRINTDQLILLRDGKLSLREYFATTYWSRWRVNSDTLVGNLMPPILLPESELPDEDLNFHLLCGESVDEFIEKEKEKK